MDASFNMRVMAFLALPEYSSSGVVINQATCMTGCSMIKAAATCALLKRGSSCVDKADFSSSSSQAVL